MQVKSLKNIISFYLFMFLKLRNKLYVIATLILSKYLYRGGMIGL